MADLSKLLFVNTDGNYEEGSSSDSVLYASFKTASYELTDTLLGKLVNAISTSAGAGDSGKYVITDSSGKLDLSFIPVSSIDHGSLTGLGDDDHAQYILASGTRAFSGDQSLGSNKLTNVSDPTLAQDAATKAYVDGLIEGRSWKNSCKAATTANITLSGAQTIDGISIVAGDRVLVKDQTTAADNGIYVASASAWSRSDDTNSATELQGAAVFVDEGTVNADKQFAQTSDNITLGTTSIAWVVTSANHFSGDDMITLSGGSISVDLATSSGLESTNPGNAAGQLRANVDGSSIEINGSNELAVKADGINDTHIDFGTGTNQVSGVDIPIADAGNYFSTDNVEVALQELGARADASGVTYTVGTGGVTKGDVVYISSNDTVVTYSTITTAKKAVGLALTTESVGNTVIATANDTVLEGVLTGATAGTVYYWTGSSLSTSIPSGSGSHVIQAGVAKNATDLSVEVRPVKVNA